MRTVSFYILNILYFTFKSWTVMKWHFYLQVGSGEFFILNRAGSSVIINASNAGFLIVRTWNASRLNNVFFICPFFIGVFFNKRL